MEAHAVSLAGGLIHDFPALTPVLQEHLDDNFGELLITSFLSDVLRWLVTNIEQQPDLVSQVVKWLEAERSQADPDSAEFIDTGFVEMLPFSSEEGAAIWEMLGPALKAEARRQGHWPDLA